MPKDMSNPFDSQAPTAGSFTVGETTFFYDSSTGASKDYRRFLLPRELPVQFDDTKSFEEKQDSFLDMVSSEMTFYRKSMFGRRRMEKALWDIKSGLKGLVRECSRLRKRKKRLHEVLHRAGRNGWEAFNLGSRVQVDKTVREFEALLWDEEDKERLRTICDFIQSHRWVRKEMKYVREHPICGTCKSRRIKTCTFTPRLVGGSVRCDHCNRRHRIMKRCPRQDDYWVHLMVKATGRPEHVVKEILDDDRFKFKTAQIYDVDSTFGRGKATTATSCSKELKIDSDPEEMIDIMVAGGGTKLDLDKLSAERDRLIKDGEQALRNVSEAIQRGHREKKKVEGSIRAIVLVAQKNIDSPRAKALLSMAPPRL